MALPFGTARRAARCALRSAAHCERRYLTLALGHCQGKLQFAGGEGFHKGSVSTQTLGHA